MATSKKPAPSKMSEAKDAKFDKAKGIKEGSKADMSKDKAMGVKDKGAKGKKC